MQYEVTVVIDASRSATVEADSPEEAADKAMDEHGHASICHQCAGELNVGDAIGAIVYDSQCETQLLGTTLHAERIAELEAEIERLRAAAQPTEVAEPEGGPPGSGGWGKHAVEMERQRDYYRERCDTMEEFRRGDAWCWQGDGGDNLESMGSNMLVAIRADQLRSLMAPPRKPTDVVVCGQALRRLLVALNGPSHYIGELQATRSLHRLGHANAIETLMEQFNSQVQP